MEALFADTNTLVVAGAAFAIVMMVGWVFSSDGRSTAAKKRVGAVAARKGGRGRRATSALDASAQRRRQVQETLKDLEARQRSARKRTLTLKAQIAQAGFTLSIKNFYILSAFVGLAAIVGVLIAGQPPLVAIAAGIGLGIGAPRWILGMLRKRRMKKFSEEFANAIDVIVRGVKSGLPLNECIQIIATESPEPVRGEFAVMAEGQSMGVSMEEGLRRMYERMPLSELNFFAIVLTIQQKTGGNLAEALNNLSIVLRSRRMMREKIQALSSEAKASALIIGSLPPGVMGIVAVTTPSYMSLMFTEPLGQMMLLGGGMWMGTGILVMRRMINFKI